MATRDELLNSVMGRYAEARRVEKGRILTEFVEVPDIIGSMRRAFYAERSGKTGHRLGRSAACTTMRLARR